MEAVDFCDATLKQQGQSGASAAGCQLLVSEKGSGGGSVKQLYVYQRFVPYFIYIAGGSSSVWTIILITCVHEYFNEFLQSTSSICLGRNPA
mmetsp:Transcript_6444/g.10175  ORF Transcript_6444/g.10175 Transcript_6444/m.10175 type:complete len:92 (-) Transcript_6444:1373-1648(-)